MALGHAQSYKVDDFYFDKGAHICHSKNQDWLSLIKASEKSNKVKSSISNYYKGNFVGYPIQNNLKDLPVKMRVNALESYFNRPKTNENIHNYRDWLLYQYGEYITDEFYEMYTKKYWRTPTSEMGTNWLSGRLIEGKDRSVINGAFDKINSEAVFAEYYYPKSGGFQNLFSEIELGKDIKFNSDIKNINLKESNLTLKCGTIYEFNKLISTIPIPEFIKASNDTYLLNLKDNFLYLNLIQSVVKLRLQKDLYEGISDWFYVYDEDIDFSRISCMNKLNNLKYSGSYVDVYFQIETFRRSDEKIDLESIKNNVLSGIKKIFPSSDLEFRDIRNIGISYVVPTIDIKNSVRKVKDYLKEYNVYSAGLYGSWEYVWSEFAFKNGLNLGKQLNE
jgi:protoporphyrinogen oxidase